MKSLEEKVKAYERFLHLLQMHVEVTLDNEKVKQLISNACVWSYAHRRGNGEISDDEQQVLIDRAFDKLCHTEKR